jgi:hypothetical protein
MLELTCESSLAYTELYLTVARIFRQYNLELFETSIGDIRMAHDFFHAGSKTRFERSADSSYRGGQRVTSMTFAYEMMKGFQ